MENELALIAARAVKAVYEGLGKNVGSTEWAVTECEYKGRPLQILAIGGSDEWLDWLWNALLVSRDGVKLCSCLSAKRIRREFTPKPGVPLLITGHSKSGPTALYLHKQLNADHCIAFCPARGFRKSITLANTTLFIDPDDVVPKLGFLSFEHPVCDIERLVDDPGLKISDHFMDHIIEYLT